MFFHSALAKKQSFSYHHSFLEISFSKDVQFLMCLMKLTFLVKLKFVLPIYANSYYFCEESKYFDVFWLFSFSISLSSWAKTENLLVYAFQTDRWFEASREVRFFSWFPCLCCLIFSGHSSKLPYSINQKIKVAKTKPPHFSSSSHFSLILLEL